MVMDLHHAVEKESSKLFVATQTVHTYLQAQVHPATAALPGVHRAVRKVGAAQIVRDKVIDAPEACRVQQQQKKTAFSACKSEVKSQHMCGNDVKEEGEEGEEEREKDPGTCVGTHRGWSRHR
jgi:hypothetical protein